VQFLTIYDNVSVTSKCLQEPTPAQWKSLETAIASCPVVCPELCLTAADQEKLLTLLLAKKNHERLLSNLIKRKVFGLP
jgi:hypothetical protein